MIKKRHLQELVFRSLCGLVFITFFASLGQAQFTCATDQVMAIYQESHPQYKKALDESLKRFNKLSAPFKNDETIVIPIHFIIIHPNEEIGEGANLSLERIQSQLDVINQDFNAMNSNYASVPEQFPTGDPNFQFCMATIGEDNMPKLGLTRYSSSLDFDDYDLMIKRETAWNRALYLNVWVSPTVDNLGYAFIPSENQLPNKDLDGIVLRTEVFGGEGFATSEQGSLGHTLTHEIAHYLGLHHLWGPREDSLCDDDDGLEDTPLQENFNFSCPTHPNPSCTNDGDMFMNFMDYTDDECRAAFTPNQISYMRLILNSSRSSIKENGKWLCSNIDSLPLRFNIINIQNNLCYGDQEGSIEVEITGGVSPYQIYLNGVISDSTLIDNLFEGEYELKVTDADGSVFLDSIKIESPPALGMDASITNMNYCEGDQYFDVQIIDYGGWGYPRIQLFDDQGNVVAALYSDSYFRNLDLGHYTVFIEDDNGCTYEDFIEVIELPAVSIQVEQIAIGACHSLNFESSVQLNADKGFPPYIFEVFGRSNESGLFDNIPSGTHVATVWDSNDCSDSIEFIIDAEDDVEIHIVELGRSDCKGSTGFFQVDSSPYEGVSFSVGTESNIHGRFENLTPGHHQLVVRNGNCETNKTVYIPPIFTPEFEVDHTDSICTELILNQGSIRIYVDAQPSFITELNDNYISSFGNFTNLDTGRYKLDLSNKAYCDTTFYRNIHAYDTEWLGQLDDLYVTCEGSLLDSFPYNLPSHLQIKKFGNFGPIYPIDQLTAGEYVIVDIRCNLIAGYLNIYAEFEFGDIYYEVTDIDCYRDSTGVVSFQVNEGWTYGLDSMIRSDGIFEDLLAGIYQFEFTNEIGCERTVSINVREASEITVDLGIFPDTGSGNGSFTIFPKGGTSPYLFSYEGVNYNDQPVFENLATGVHVFHIKDANECMDSFFVYIPLETSTLEVSEEISQIYAYGKTVYLKQLSEEDHTQVSIYNLMGAKVFSGNIRGKRQQEIRLNHLSDGIYIIASEILGQIRLTKVYLSNSN